ncbi:phage tail protein [Alteraurantiacibacter palmitatis]|uniref:Phage tail protein n=1 Tax=Alteraurantiacibacter palmitatis TaxID=2054628 RepID=A0ABV7E684_9SPHN
MAEADGVLSDGTELWLTNGAAVLTKVKGLMSVNRPNLSVAKVENTDHDSGGTKGYIPGHGDWGELKAKIKYEPGSVTDQLINEHLASKEKRPFKIVTVSEDGSTEDNTATIFLMGYEPDEAPLGGIRTATITGQPGPIAQAPSA